MDSIYIPKVHSSKCLGVFEQTLGFYSLGVPGRGLLLAEEREHDTMSSEDKTLMHLVQGGLQNPNVCVSLL